MWGKEPFADWTLRVAAFDILQFNVVNWRVGNEAGLDRNCQRIYIIVNSKHRAFQRLCEAGHSGVVSTVNTAKLRRLSMAVADFHVLDGNGR
jgi:hypothetical protein